MRGTWGGNLDIHPVKITMKWRMGATVAQTGFYLRRMGLLPVNVEAAAQHVHDNFVTPFRALLLVSDQYVGTDAVDLVSGEAASVSGNNAAGSVANDPLASYVTIIVNLKGELRRKYGQGRMMWAPRSEEAVSGNALSPLGVTAYTSLVSEFAEHYLDGGITDGWHAINVHGLLPARAATQSRPARPEIPPSWYDVTSAQLNTRLSFLRSRKEGVGS